MVKLTETIHDFEDQTWDLMSMASAWLSHWYEMKTWAGAGTPCSSFESRMISRTSNRLISFKQAQSISTQSLERQHNRDLFLL